MSNCTGCFNGKGCEFKVDCLSQDVPLDLNDSIYDLLYEDQIISVMEVEIPTSIELTGLEALLNSVCLPDSQVDSLFMESAKLQGVFGFF